MVKEYYRLLDVLAEWFMHFFFDPAYHPIRENNDQHQFKKSRLTSGIQQLNFAVKKLTGQLKDEKSNWKKRFNKYVTTPVVHLIYHYIEHLLRLKFWLQVQHLH